VTTPQSDTIDLADVVRSLRRGWRSVVACTVGGLAVAAGVQLLAPPRFAGTASVVLRSPEPLSGLSRLMGSGSNVLGSDAAEVITGSKSQMDTELQILESSDLAAIIVDSLRLQARVRSPRGVSPWLLLSSLDLPSGFRKQKIAGERTADGRVRLTGASVDTTVRVGETVRLLGGSLTLREGQIPQSFRIQLLDREDALKWFRSRRGIAKAGGEVARVAFQADDSLTAARVPNLLVDQYLVRRKTTDRGVNQSRVEFLALQVDSTEVQLSAAERALRRFQESSGVLNAEVAGRVGVERGAELRKELAAVQVEQGAIEQLLRLVAADSMDRRQIAAFPTFVRGSALNEMVSQLSLLDAERLRLLERRTERDPEVQALTQSIAATEAQFVPMAEAYAASLARRQTDLSAQLDSLRAELGVLPGAAESGNRLQREVLRLGQIYGGLQAQLVQARLAAIGEGGNVRQLDIAMVPKKPVFPRAWATFGAGGLAGVLAGVIAALALSTFGRWARDPVEIARAAGVPTLHFDGRVPLIVSNGATRAVLVVPLYREADALSVAKQVVATAVSRGVTATLLDLGESATRTNLPAADVSAQISRLGGQFSTVVVHLPVLTAEATLAALSHERTAVLVVPTGRVARDQLVAAMETLRRLDVPCAGIVVSGGRARPGLMRGTAAIDA